MRHWWKFVRTAPWWPAGIMLALAIGFHAAAWLLGGTEHAATCTWCGNLWLIAFAGDAATIALLSAASFAMIPPKGTDTRRANRHNQTRDS